MYRLATARTVTAVTPVDSTAKTRLCWRNALSIFSNGLATVIAMMTPLGIMKNPASMMVAIVVHGAVLECCAG